MQRTVFEAIADPTRRAMLDRLRDANDGLTAGELGDGFAMSQPACSKHLRVLRDCGLVETTAEGRAIRYRLAPDGLGPVQDWLRPYAAFWTDRIAKLEQFLTDDAAASPPSSERDAEPETTP